MSNSHSDVAPGQITNLLESQSPEIALPRVTVIVTCFNYARYVSQALDSVLSQTYRHFDCVVVDDASTDDSGLLIERWIEENKDPRFRLLRNPENSGQTASFSAGLAATSSEFVAFLDADDFWFPQFIQRHVEAHLNRSFPASLSCSDLVQVDDERRILSSTLSGTVFHERHTRIDTEYSARIDPSIARVEFSESPKIQYIHPSYSEYPWTVTSGMMFRRSALDLIMPRRPDELRICTDWYVFVICQYLTGSLAINSALGAYRRHGGNNFVSNPVMGSDLPSAPSAITRHQKTVLGVMLRHLLDHYDQFKTIFAAEYVRELVRILFTKALRENLSIWDPRIRIILGARGVFKAKVKAKFFFLGRLRTLLR